MKPACVLFMALTLWGCHQVNEDQTRFANIYQLSAVPEKYDGQRVVVHGFLAEQGGAYILVDNRDLINHAEISSGILIEVHRDQNTLHHMNACVGRFVQVASLFAHSERWGLYGLIKPESIFANGDANCLSGTEMK